MANEFWIAIVVLGFFALAVVAKVLSYMRESDRQWSRVDKSKLKAWDDEGE